MAASTTTTSSKKKQKGHSKTLGSLLTHLEGIELVVELKTGRMYRGILSNSDEYMNLTLDDAVDERLRERRAQEQPDNNSIAALPDNSILLFTSLHIRGPTIRYIHFPDHADLPNLIKASQEREKTGANKYSRGRRKTSKPV
jgi:small nuclear ribonucleoprotein (snRNP)-like protein